MSNLAQNQYDFQVYNQKMNGPTSPVPIETLKTNAETEKIKEAALGRVFNIDTQSYEATDDASRMNLSTTEEIAKVIEEPQTLGKRKQEEIIQFTKSTYEVYTTSPVADAWPVMADAEIRTGVRIGLHNTAGMHLMVHVIN